MKAIDIKNLYYNYDNNNHVLKDINLEVERGETIVILGSSGVGKSTLFRCMTRLTNPEPTKGKIIIDNRDVLSATKREMLDIRKDIGVIHQGFGLHNIHSAIEGVLCGRLAHNRNLKSIMGIFQNEDYRIAAKNLKRVGLEKYTNGRIGNLSGGQKQRVGIARALSQEPKIILADEPVSNLDPRLMVEVMDLIKKICKEDNLTLIANLHIIKLAKRYADRIVGMRDGKIVFNDITEKLDDQAIEKIYGKTEENTIF